MKKVSAKKHFGQHFLNEPSIAKNIVNQLEFADTYQKLSEGADAIVILTEWHDFKIIDWDEVPIVNLKLN